MTHVVVASDLNPRYLDFWELAQRAWLGVARLEPILVLVADSEAVPAALRQDQRVRLFPPITGLHTAFQAQFIRLLYPALLDVPGAVLVSDIELMPMAHSYFHRPLGGLDSSFFVSYRDVLLPRGEIAVCYNAASPSTWGEIFRIEGPADVAVRLQEWGEGIDYEGVRGGRGWYRDQLALHDVLLAWRARTDRLWLLDDQFTGYRRLDRIDIERDGALTTAVEREILRGAYTDFHCPVPQQRFRELNERVINLAMLAGPDRGRRV